MTLALYARVSSDRQEREQTIDSQVAGLRRFAAEQGEPDAQLFTDDGWTGAKLERPGLTELRAGLTASQFSAVAVWDVDRLSRDQADLFTLVKEIRKAGAVLWTVKSGQRFEDTDEGRILFTVFTLTAELERRRIGERARRGGKHRAAVEGRKNGGIASFGFALEDGRYVLEPSEVAWCRQMRDWLLEGVTPGLIAQRLMLLEVPTRYDTLGLVRTGSRRRANSWYPDQVRRILTHPLYGGEWQYHAWDGDTITVPVPAIFTAAELDQHARLIARNVSLRIRSDGKVNILRSLVFCGVCGRRYIAGVASKQRIYRCGVFHRPRTLRDCWNKGWTALRLEGAVWGAVGAFIADPATALAAVEAAGADPDRPELRAAQLESRLSQLDVEDERVRAGFRGGVYDLPQSQAELARSDKARRLIHGELDEIRSRVLQRVRLADLERAAAEFRDELPYLDHEGRGAILAELILRVTVTGQQIEIELVVPTNETGQAVPSVGQHIVLRA